MFKAKKSLYRIILIKANMKFKELSIYIITLSTQEAVEVVMFTKGN